MFKNESFTLTELLVVIVIIGILVALALPNYGVIKEKSLDREAKASLALIQAAEKIYKLEQGWYYPRPAGAQNVAATINSYLKLSLPENTVPPPLWSINVSSAAEIATATRTGVGADGRQWTINLPGETDPCTGGAACP